MAENRQSGTRPYDDVVVICRGKRQSVVKALTSVVGLPSDFVRKGLLLRSGYVRELAAASYPHIHGSGGDFPCIAGGRGGGWRLI